jgi:hypothetical protein
MFTSAYHRLLSLAIRIQFTSVSLTIVLILSFCLHLGLLSCLYPSGIVAKRLQAFFISHTHTCLNYLIVLGSDLTNNV